MQKHTKPKFKRKPTGPSSRTRTAHMIWYNYGTQQNSSDNVPSYAPDIHQVVY